MRHAGKLIQFQVPGLIYILGAVHWKPATGIVWRLGDRKEDNFIEVVLVRVERRWG